LRTALDTRLQVIIGKPGKIGYNDEMNQSHREYFDRQVEWELSRLPQNVSRLLKEVPLHVEDQPSKRLMQTLELEDAAELCGYFSGVPHNAPDSLAVYLGYPIPMPNSVTIFRRGIVAAARNEQGKVSRHNLREQIRITILHELAHLLGMDEDEIAEIGYG
jgi:predicted Zn-dependent protease with MMP-like domain